MSSQNLNPIPLRHLHELLLLLLPPIPLRFRRQINFDQHHTLLSFSFVIIVSPALKTSAQATILVRKVLITSSDVALARTSTLFFGGGISWFFDLLPAPAFFSLETLPSAVEAVKLKSFSGSPVLLSTIHRGGAIRYQQSF